MTSTAGPGRPRRWAAGLAWALWLASLLCLAAVPWLDQLLRRAGRADLVQFVFPSVAVPVLALVSSATVGAVVAARRPAHPVGWLLLGIALSLTATAATAQYFVYGLLVRPGARGPLRRAVPAGDHVHGPDPDRLRPAADAHRVAALAPLALAGQGDGGHAGRPGAGGDPGRRAGGPALPGPGRPLRPPWPRRGPGGGQPDGLAVTVVGLVAAPRPWWGGSATPAGWSGCSCAGWRWPRCWWGWAPLASCSAWGSGGRPPGPCSTGPSAAVCWWSRRWPPGRRCCATGCTTWTGSSAAPWPTGCSPWSWAAATPPSPWSSVSSWAGTRAWPWPGPPWSAAALFQPARRRVQAVVDQRFNRRRHDAARIIEGFGARLRDQVDLDTLTTDLLAVVDQTIQPTHRCGYGHRQNRHALQALRPRDDTVEPEWRATLDRHDEYNLPFILR